MTADEYIGYCKQAFEGLPAHVRKDIREHLAVNSVQMEFVVSDKRINGVEQELGKKFPSAITVFSYPNRMIVVMFRECLLNAPAAIAHPIITHELVHMLVGPVLHPAKEHKPVSNMHRRHVEKASAEMERTPQFKQARLNGIDYEELLVSFILATWGIDESAALNWIRENTAA